MKGKDYDLMAKVIVIGDSGVGKTNIILKFAECQFKDNYVSTIGVDVKTKTLLIGNKRIKLQIWDTAGQERYRTITENYYKGASAIMLTYAVNDRNSFEHLEKWIVQISEKVPAGVPRLIVANKADLPQSERVITAKDGRRLAERHFSSQQGTTFMEVSAKTGENIEQAFKTLSMQVEQESERCPAMRIVTRPKESPGGNCFCLK